MADPSPPAVDFSELVEARHRWLLERLRERHRVVTKDAAAALGVSVDTVRRDLRLLRDRGLLRRVHGGAVPVADLPSSFSGRSTESSARRGALAEAVVDRFSSGDLIGLDAGSTNVEIAARIPQTLEVTVVTNSPAAAVALTDHRSAKVILLGGDLNLTWMAATGPDTVDGWRRFHLDLAVLGACAFDPITGAATRSQQEVATKRALIGAAAETILPLQSEKLGAVAPFRVVDPDSIDHLIVDRSASTEALRPCRRLVASRARRRPRHTT